MEIDLRDKVVVITGASSGIGREAALLFAKEGSRVVIAARRAELLERLLHELEGGPERHLFCPADISKKEDAQRLASETMRKYGRIDILINNAAVSYVGLVEDMDLEGARKVIDINLLGTIGITRCVIKHMIAAKAGHIMTVTTVNGKRAVPYRSVYCATKFGIEGFMESLRSEVDERNIKVSIIRPPSVRTDFSKKITSAGDIICHELDALEARDVALRIVKVAKRPRRETNLGILAKGYLFLNGIFPGLFDKIIKITDHNRQRR